MKKPFVVVKRYPYEEPYHLHLDLIVSNGAFEARTDLYLDVQGLKEIGEALSAFPKQVPDEYVFEYGSERPEDRVDRYLLLRAVTVGNTGRSALQVRVNLNRKAPHDGIAQFSIPVEPAALNRLGALFSTFHELRHLEFQWNEVADELFENHQPEFVL